MSTELRILPTTIDNPYDPFTDYDRWWHEDQRLGYDTVGTLAALAPPTSEIDEASADEEAIRLLIEYNFSGKHIGAVPTDFDPFLKVKNL